ncbi:hypothetical protein FNU76_17685 [Chitinimonas arctica]|uniref:Uncharacterized protein n=1 Tax=Chitinimonas arctica TaxID=2594795 RepID=A0A516SJ07_9NEIS|nr:hypothetical protein [Chitinimonas arctica]QDQ28028.1 hypothetical protein FNU76_17685 [Chitinimonas arctica]
MEPTSNIGMTSQTGTSCFSRTVSEQVGKIGDSLISVAKTIAAPLKSAYESIFNNDKSRSADKDGVPKQQFATGATDIQLSKSANLETETNIDVGKSNKGVFQYALNQIFKCGEQASRVLNVIGSALGMNSEDYYRISYDDDNDDVSDFEPGVNTNMKSAAVPTAGSNPDDDFDRSEVPRPQENEVLSNFLQFKHSGETWT